MNERTESSLCKRLWIVNWIIVCFIIIIRLIIDQRIVSFFSHQGNWENRFEVASHLISLSGIFRFRRLATGKLGKIVAWHIPVVLLQIQWLLINYFGTCHQGDSKKQSRFYAEIEMIYRNWKKSKEHEYYHNWTSDAFYWQVGDIEWNIRLAKKRVPWMLHQSNWIPWTLPTKRSPWSEYKQVWEAGRLLITFSGDFFISHSK